MKKASNLIWSDVFFIWNVSNAFVGDDQRLPKPTACLVSEPMMA